MPEELAESSSQEATQGALDALSALPIGAHLTVVVAILVGLTLWLFGRSIAKPAFFLVGGLLGAAAGFLLLPAFGAPTIADVPSPYIGLGVGAAVGLIVAGVVFRFTMALASASVAGIAALLISSIYVTANPPDPETTEIDTPALASIAPPLTLFQLRLPGVPSVDRPKAIPVGHFQPTSQTGQPEREPEWEIVDPEDPAPATEQPADPTLDPEPLSPAAPLEAPDPTGDPLDDASLDPLPQPGSLEDSAQRVRDFIEVLSSELRLIWSSQSEEGRLIVLGSTVIGAALGFILGLAAPNRAAIVITAMAGAAIWLPSAVALAHALEMPFREALLWGPRVWLIAWMVTSVIGVASQLVLARRPVDEETAGASDA